MRRLFLLLALAFRLRARALISSGASAILVVIGGLFYLGLSGAMGVAAYVALSSSRLLGLERAGDFTALVVTLLGVLFLTRPLILSSLGGGSLQNLLHLPIHRRELLAYSFVTGVLVPLLFESPVLIGAALGAARQPVFAVVTLPLVLLAHLILLAGAHAMSLFAILIARRTWVSDAARLFALSLFFLPSLLSYRSVRAFLQPALGPVAQISPLGWAPRAAIYAGAGDFPVAVWFAIPALLTLVATAFVSMRLLNRILDGSGHDRPDAARAKPKPARVFLPGAFGALLETLLRSQLRSPSARMALFMPALMMGLFAFSLARSGATASPVAIMVFLSLSTGTGFLVLGRGLASVLGTPVSRASLLMATDVATLPFRLPPLLAVIAVASFQTGRQRGASMAGIALVLIPIGLALQHFVSILRPVASPRDRLNPFAQRAEATPAGSAMLSLLASVATLALSAPFLFLLWLSSRVEGYGPWLLALGPLGALAMYAVLIALAENLFLRRELRVLEVVLDDAPV